MGKQITRKSFIKEFASACGLFALGPISFVNAEKSSSGDLDQSNKKAVYFTSGDKGQIRGSWVRRGAPQKEDVTLSERGNICQIVIGAEENSAVHQAGRFLADDVKKITGFRPQIVEKAGDSAQSTIHLVTYGEDEIPDDIDAGELEGEWESYSIITGDKEVWLVGANFRGTAFAAYELAERLGIDPLYIWTGYSPETFKTLVLKKTDYFATPPTVKYRGLFHDDEDILPRPFDYYSYPLFMGDINLKWYKRYFETALRLKMNMVAPYTRAHRRYEVQQTASKWGLFYTSHHYDILLSNPYGLKRFNLAEKRNIDPEWDWFKNQQGMTKYWKGGVLQNNALNCIWPVGLRGTNDYGYSFPKGMSDKEQDEVYNNVINTQVDIVNDNLPSDKKSVFHLTLYTEMLNKFQKHRDEFNLSDDVIIVWPDDNNGNMRALPKNKGKWKHGVYYHLAYLGPRAITKQITHITPPARVAAQFSDIISSGATEFWLINVSELRDYVLGARLISRMAWEPEPMLNSTHPGNDYLRWWTKEYFGEEAAADAKHIYDRFYEVLAKPPELWYGADMVQSLIDKLIKKFNGQSFGNIDPQKINKLERKDDEYRSILNTAKKAQDKMSRQQRQYFYENALLGLLIDWRPTQAAITLNKALNTPNLSNAWNLVEEAMKPLEKLEVEIKRAERPPFEKWYRETWIRTKLSPYNVHRSYQQLRAFVASEGTEKLQAAEDNGIVYTHNLRQDKIWARFLNSSDKTS